MTRSEEIIAIYRDTNKDPKFRLSDQQVATAVQPLLDTELTDDQIDVIISILKCVYTRKTLLAEELAILNKYPTSVKSIILLVSNVNHFTNFSTAADIYNFAITPPNPVEECSREDKVWWQYDPTWVQILAKEIPNRVLSESQRPLGHITQQLAKETPVMIKLFIKEINALPADYDKSVVDLMKANQFVAEYTIQLAARKSVWGELETIHQGKITEWIKSVYNTIISR